MQKGRRYTQLASMAGVGLATFGLSSVSEAQTPFGDNFTPTAITGGFSMGGFESFSGGSVEALTATSTPGVYQDAEGDTYQSTVVPGTSTPALLVNIGANTGFDNALVFDFAAQGLTSAFKANDIISFNVTYTAQSNGSGQNKMTQWTINSGPSGGFEQQSNTTGDMALNGYPTTSQVTFNVTENYDSIKSTVPTSPTYLQYIQGVQDYNGSYPTFYFSNFELTAVPEPASATLMGLASLGMISRRRKRTA